MAQGSEGLLQAIKRALDKPAGSFTHVDIIHTEDCDTQLEGSEPLGCSCDPEYVEHRVN